MPPYLRRLKQRKIVQWVIAYAAAAWLSLEDFDLVAEQFFWPAWIRQAATIPGIGHVLLHVGTWFWNLSTQTLVHHGPDYALAEGETGLDLCEASAWLESSLPVCSSSFSWLIPKQ
jgi:hypothetical protein